MSVESAISDGRAAWVRLKGERKTWSDWLAVGRALQIGKAAAMQTAQTNRAVGTKYNRAMAAWLADHGLDGVSAQERYRLGLILENLTEVGTWRNGLDDAQRRRLNHPGAIWHAWRRSLRPAVSPRQKTDASPQEVVQQVAEAARRSTPVFWPQEHLRRAHAAMIKSSSHDLLTLARAALQGAVRSAEDLVALLPADPPTPPKPAPVKPPLAAMVLA